jgi:hypothetical protein
MHFAYPFYFKITTSTFLTHVFVVEKQLHIITIEINYFPLGLLLSLPTYHGLFIHLKLARILRVVVRVLA